MRTSGTLGISQATAKQDKDKEKYYGRQSEFTASPWGDRGRSHFPSWYQPGSSRSTDEHARSHPAVCPEYLRQLGGAAHTADRGHTAIAATVGTAGPEAARSLTEADI